MKSSQPQTASLCGRHDPGLPGEVHSPASLASRPAGPSWCRLWEEFTTRPASFILPFLLPRPNPGIPTPKVGLSAPNPGIPALNVGISALNPSPFLPFAPAPNSLNLNKLHNDPHLLNHASHSSYPSHPRIEGSAERWQKMVTAREQWRFSPFRTQPGPRSVTLLSCA